MNNREIITRVIERRDAPRIGFCFNAPHQNDIIWLSIGDFQNAYQKYEKWGKYLELMKHASFISPDFFVHCLNRYTRRWQMSCIIVI